MKTLKWVGFGIVILLGTVLVLFRVAPMAIMRLMAIGNSESPGGLIVELSPDASVTCVSNIDGHYFSMTADGKHTVLSPKGGPLQGLVGYAPDGVATLFIRVVQGKAQVCLGKRDGSGVRCIDDGSGNDDTATFAPDGSHILFTRGTRNFVNGWGGTMWADHDVWIMNSDGTGARQLTHANYFMLNAAHFSPDGSCIAFSADSTPGPGRSGGMSIWLMDVRADGSVSAPAPITMSRAYADPKVRWDTDEHFMPDGHHLVFISSLATSQSPFDYDVWTCDLSGGSLVRLSANGSYNTSPVPSRDGRQVYFLSDPGRDGRTDVWRANANGSGSTKIGPAAR